VVLRERVTDDLYFRSAHGEKGAEVKRLRVPMGAGVVGWVAAQKTALIVNDPARDPRHRKEVADRVGYHPRNILCVPLIAEEEVLGAIELLDKVDESGFSATDQKLLALIAAQASSAIQLARAKEERAKEGRLASIGQIVSGVLHDLKTPMTIVSGYAQLMAQMDDPEQRQQYVDQILKQFDNMSAMTREVLAFARGESNVLVRKVFVHRFIDDMAGQLKHEFAGRNIELVVVDAYRGAAWFDEQKMIRVVHNIARNAGQAMPQGGKFTFTVKAEAPHLIMEFADTGEGIPAEMEGRLFELFATSGKQDGTGLGLAIVKKIVDDHRGQITYTSSPGAGTTFRIQLALDKPVEPGQGDDDPSRPRRPTKP
jgi:signal transduction histidine kinase